MDPTLLISAMLTILFSGGLKFAELVPSSMVLPLKALFNAIPRFSIVKLVNSIGWISSDRQ